MKDIYQTPKCNFQQKVPIFHLFKYLSQIEKRHSDIFSSIITVSKHTARGSIHQQITEWLKTGSLNDIGCRPEAKVSKENFDGNINNFNKDETEEENGRVPPENSKNDESYSNEDFKKWFQLVQTHHIDQYAERTMKSIKSWFTLIPNEENMKMSPFR